MSCTLWLFGTAVGRRDRKVGGIWEGGLEMSLEKKMDMEMGLWMVVSGDGYLHREEG